MCTEPRAPAARVLQEGQQRAQAQRLESRTGEVSPGLAGGRAGWTRPPQPRQRSLGGTGWPTSWGLQETRREGGLRGSWQPSSHTKRSFFQGTECLLWPISQWPNLGLTVGAGPQGLQHTALSPASPWQASGESLVRTPRRSMAALPCCRGGGCPGGRALPVHTHLLPTAGAGAGPPPFPLEHIETPLQAVPAAALPQSLFQPGHSSTPHTCPPVT